MNSESAAGCIGEHRQRGSFAIILDNAEQTSCGTEGCVETVRLPPVKAMTQSSQQAFNIWRGHGNMMLEAKPLVGGSSPSGGASKLENKNGLLMRAIFVVGNRARHVAPLLSLLVLGHDFLIQRLRLSGWFLPAAFEFLSKLLEVRGCFAATP